MNKPISLCIVMFFIALLFLNSSCKDNDSQTQYCGVENPAEDLDWLRIEIKVRKQATDSIEVYRMEMPSLGEIGFSVQFESEGSPLPTRRSYYTCNGTYICSSRGEGFDSDCSEEQGKVVLGELVYKGYE